MSLTTAVDLHHVIRGVWRSSVVAACDHADAHHAAAAPRLPPRNAAGVARIGYNDAREAGQTVAGPRRKVVDGRKVRTPQSGVTVNGRPLKAAWRKPAV